jgi:hypothetical protein
MANTVFLILRPVAKSLRSIAEVHNQNPDFRVYRWHHFSALTQPPFPVTALGAACQADIHPGMKKVKTTHNFHIFDPHQAESHRGIVALRASHTLPLLHNDL